MATAEEIANLYLTPRARELDRLDRYVNGNQYEGRVDWFDNASNVPIVERAPCIRDPIVQSAINSHTGFILGEGRWPTITSATSEDDRTLDEEWGLSKDDSDILDRFINVVLMRYASLQLIAIEMLSDSMKARSSAVVVSVLDGRLRAETLRAAWCTPEIDPHGNVTKLEVKYPYIETFYNDRTDQWERRCMLYRRVIDEKSDTVYKPAIGLENGKEPRWVVDDDRTTKKHGLGFCPVVWYPFKKPCSTVESVDGIALHEYQLSEVDCLNITLSQKQRAATVAGDPQAVETGVAEDVEPAPIGRQSRGIAEQREIPVRDANGNWTSQQATMFRSASSGMGGSARKRGAGVIWRYPDPKSKVEYLTIPADALKATEEHGKDIRNKIAEALHVVFIDPKDVHTHSELSGKALSFLFQNQLSYCDTIRTDFGDKGLLALVSMLLRVIYCVGKDKPGAIFLPGLKKTIPILEKFEVEVEGVGKLWMPPRLSNVWGPYFAPHEADQLNVVRLAVEALKGGIITVEMAVEKLAQSGVFDVASAKEVAIAIASEQAAMMGADDAAMNRILGADATPASGSGHAVAVTHSAAGDVSAALRTSGKQSTLHTPGVGDGGSNGGQAPISSVKPAGGASQKPGLAKASAKQTVRQVQPQQQQEQPQQPLYQRGVTTAGVAETVYQQLAEDYPPEAISWVRGATWDGPMDVPTDHIDYSLENEWKASSDGKLPEFIEKIQDGVMKPIILVNEPNNEKLFVADGHHRALAYRELGIPAPAYVATVGMVNGDWVTMHGKQIKNGKESEPNAPKDVKKPVQGNVSEKQEEKSKK